MPSAQRCAGPAAGSSTEQQRSHRLHIGAGHARRMKIDQRSPFDVRQAAPPAANTAHNSAACRRVRQRCRKIMKMCNEAPCVPPQCWRCLRRYRHCCQSATRRRQVERRLLPTKGHRLRPVARLKWCPVHVDGRRAPGPQYEAAPSTKLRPVLDSQYFPDVSPAGSPFITLWAWACYQSTSFPRGRAIRTQVSPGAHLGRSSHSRFGFGVNLHLLNMRSNLSRIYHIYHEIITKFITVLK